MAAPAVVAFAIQALGELSPVQLVVLAVSTISLTTLSVYSLVSGDYSSPYLTKRGFLHPFVATEVKAICHVHYRVWNANPIHQPETFFDILDLNSSQKPFVDNTWLTEGRVFSPRSAKDHHGKVGRATEQIEGMGTHHARIYTLQFLSKIKHKRGEDRLVALDKICKGFWGAQQFKDKKEL
ncbi:hypothetical protein FPCIR_6062 [Fusarium pseudocircinatum]|uniref:Uncharacterized protein n=1 Tax=Fusarium pseudocircinatum TaxID=56676 RepID=A0A8H5P7G0_9HYPO|nr:hypothetical protein FPCIR_6062 [Fusarium pseudocircinatum]